MAYNPPAEPNSGSGMDSKVSLSLPPLTYIKNTKGPQERARREAFAALKLAPAFAKAPRNEQKACVIGVVTFFNERFRRFLLRNQIDLNTAGASTAILSLGSAALCQTLGLSKADLESGNFTFPASTAAPVPATLPAVASGSSGGSKRTASKSKVKREPVSDSEDDEPLAKRIKVEDEEEAVDTAPVEATSNAATPEASAVEEAGMPAVEASSEAATPEAPAAEEAIMPAVVAVQQATIPAAHSAEKSATPAVEADESVSLGEDVEDETLGNEAVDVPQVPATRAEAHDEDWAL